MSDNWIVQNLENALEVWNDKLSEIWQLITQSPHTFKGGSTLFFDGAAILPRARFHEFIYSVSPEAIFTGGSLN